MSALWTLDMQARLEQLQQVFERKRRAQSLPLAALAAGGVVRNARASHEEAISIGDPGRVQKLCRGM